MKSTFIFFLILVTLFLFDLTAQEKKDDKTLTLYLKTEYNTLKIEKTSSEILEVFIKICRLIENANESDDPFLIFKEKKKELIQLFKNASGITQNLQYKKYLNTLSENILNDKYIKSYSDWLNIRERTIDIIIKPPEKQKKISFFLLKIDQIKSKKYEKYILLIDKMMANSTMKNTSSPLRLSIENPFLFFDVLHSSTMNRFVFIHPDQLIEDQKNGSFKIIFCINIIKFYFEEILKPISKLILEKPLIKFVEFDAYLSNLVMHRISHTLGPFNADSKSEDLTSPQEKLKELFYCIEEIKADAVSICNSAVLLKEKLISESGEKSMYVLFVLNLLDKIRTNPLEKEKNPFLVILNYLLRKEGLIYDINQQKLLINFFKLKGELKNLMNEVIEIEKSGSFSRAKKFIEGYSSVSNMIKLILKNIEKIPEKVKIAVN